MNPIADEILSILDDDNALMHYGRGHKDGGHSGRYPYGSGEHPFQHANDFLTRIEELKAQGLSETERAKAIGLSTTQLRVQVQLASHERRQAEATRAKKLREEGYSLDKIAQMMGYKNDSSIRALLNEVTYTNKNKAFATADMLRKEIEAKRMIDVGAGVERELGVSRQVLDEALYILEREGYPVYGVGIPQVTNTGKQSNTKVLGDKDVSKADPYQNVGDIQSVGDYHTIDGGKTWDHIEYPASISADRVMIRYRDEGGLSKDGTMEIRRGVADLDLGDSHYAQVRILVNDTHYLKGMALYSDDMPPGVDIVFNTNKTNDVPMLGGKDGSVLKPIKSDPDNPFGAYVPAKGQSHYTDKDGNEKLSAINKLKAEGDWDSMSRSLSAQFLSKQPMELINKQLDLSYADKVAEFDDICALENPTIKRKYLLDYADGLDAARVHLKAAALPRQSTKVILPIDALKDTEVYAPTYNNGETVVLIRYPHGGTFEIPRLVVNNKNPSAKSILGTPKDAIGINSAVAERLSGADFDGDTVMVIPVNDKVKVKTTSPLRELVGFDPKVAYSTEGKTNIRLMRKSEVQKEMGMVSNLINDMTLKGCTEEDLAKAVKHSMVVIDAYKHELDYKQSERDNDIPMLKRKYQQHTDLDGELKVSGAATLLSRKRSDVRIPETQGSGRIDPETGKVVYKESGRTYYDSKKGEYVLATKKVPLISTVSDAHVLSTGTQQEEAYADYANKLSALAAQARKEYLNTGRLEYSASAAKMYAEEVQSLNNKLDIASRNSPRERRAQAIANSVVKAKVKEYPELKTDKKELKKVKQIAINEARASVGASSKDARITISDKEWRAIQAGAISDSKLSTLLRYTDTDNLRARAMPKSTTSLSTAKVNKIKSMVASGYTQAEIAASLGISASTVNKYI